MQHEQSLAELAFTGLSIIGDINNVTNEETMLRAIDHFPYVLSGHHDKALLCALYLGGTHTLPQSEQDLQHPRALQALDSLKHEVREIINEIFRQAEREDKQAARLKLEQVRTELKQSAQPHEMGTVAEIAAKYGISKSEVRRRKAEGTLHELIG